MILGIIPAAGEGIRWGGYYKELLPIGERDWLLGRIVRTMREGGAERILVVSSIPKISAHATHLGNEDIFFVIQKGGQDIWSAVKESYSYAEDLNFFAMPDTVIPLEAFKREFKSDFTLGIFKTRTPERFGVLQGRQIVDKCLMPHTQILSYHAWGVLVWTKRVVDFWETQKIEDYTHAINLAMKEFGFETFRLSYYYDMASWTDYKDFLKRLK